MATCLRGRIEVDMHLPYRCGTGNMLFFLSEAFWADEIAA